MHAFMSRFGTTAFPLAAIVAVASVTVSPARGAAFATFDQTTDTIQAAGQTVIGTTATYEAVVQFTNGLQAGGNIYNEWTNFLEDKQLNVGPTYVFGYNHPVSSDANTFPATLSLNTWHHVAYVLDGTQERFYLDGTLVGSRGASGGDVGDSDGLGFVGGVFRDGVVRGGFLGEIDSLRLSKVARYSGNSFVPTIGNLPTDANTLLLYNFEEPPGSPTIADSSGNGHTGTVGVGFPGATSPTLLPEPGGAAIIVCAAGPLLRRRARARRS